MVLLRQERWLRLKSLGRKIRETVPLTVFLFALWIIFTGDFVRTDMVLGAVAAVLFARMSLYLLGGRLDPNLTWKVGIRLPVFAVLLLWEILKASWDVFIRVIRPSLPISPRIVDFQSYLESDIARTALANSITLTPGTVTIEITGDRFFVHCLAAEHQEGLLGGRLERMVAWLFSEGPSGERSLR